MFLDGLFLQVLVVLHKVRMLLFVHVHHYLQQMQALIKLFVLDLQRFYQLQLHLLVQLEPGQFCLLVQYFQMSILLILTAMGAIIFFVIKARRPGREKQSWETTISRQSELGGSSNNDLELQVEDDKPDAAAGSYGPPTGGYSSPAIGTFI